MKRILGIAATVIALAACSKNRPAESPAATGDTASYGTSYDTSIPGAAAAQPSTGAQSDTTWGSPGNGTPWGSGTDSTSGRSGAGTSSAGTSSSGTSGSSTSGSGMTGSDASSGSSSPPPADVYTPPAAAPGAAPVNPNADNTANNKRDRSSAVQTPIDQGNGQSDLKITQQIRKAVMGDKSLSFTAKNVKIITKDGHVTLRGAVKTDQERASIEAAARRISSDVDNQIEVKKLEGREALGGDGRRGARRQRALGLARG